MNKLIRRAQHQAVLFGLEVVQQSPAAMGVTVHPGECICKAGWKEFTSDTNVSLDAADATNPRKDLIIVDSSGTITKVTGTPEAANPSDKTGPETSAPKPPNIPSGAVVLAEIWVAAGATSITNSDITDRRVLLRRNHVDTIPVWTRYTGDTEETDIYSDPQRHVYAGAQYLDDKNKILVVGGRDIGIGNRSSRLGAMNTSGGKLRNTEDKTSCPTAGDAGYSAYINGDSWTAKTDTGVSRWDNHSHRNVYNGLAYMVNGASNGTAYADLRRNYR